MNVDTPIMTELRLEQLKALKKEIRFLEAHRIGLQETSAHPSIDVVQSSMHEFPYTQGRVTIEGVVEHAHIKRQLQLVQERINARELEINEIQHWIDEIQDPLIRQIIHLRYILGLNWTAVALKLGGFASESGARMALKRFFKKTPVPAPHV